MSRRHMAPIRDGNPEHLHLATAEGSGPSFVRCASCEGDNTRFAVECQHCGAALDTPAQRASNAVHWAARQRQRQDEQAQLDAWERANELAADHEARQRRALYEGQPATRSGMLENLAGRLLFGVLWPLSGPQMRRGLWLLVGLVTFGSFLSIGGWMGGLGAASTALLIGAALLRSRRP